MHGIFFRNVNKKPDANVVFFPPRRQEEIRRNFPQMAEINNADKRRFICDNLRFFYLRNLRENLSP